MNYTTPAAIYAEIPAPRVNDALDDDGSGDPALISALLTQIIANASNMVDGALAARYTVPFTAPFPQLVSDAALIFSCEKIWARRPQTEMKNPFFARAEEYRQKLKDIAERKLALDVLNDPESPGAKAGCAAPVLGRIATLPVIGP